MSYEPEHEAFRESFRAFIERDVRPLSGPVITSGAVPDKVFAVAGENGFLGTGAPAEHGGAGTGGIRFALLAAEELTAAGLPGVALAFAAHAAVAIPLLAQRGDPRQRERWLSGLAAGTVLAAVARGASGSIRLNPRGDGGAPGGGVLDGAADAVVSATRAGLLIVPAQTASGQTRVVLVDASAPGVTRRADRDAAGLPGADTGRVEFRSVPVCPDAILSGAGTEDDAALLADERLVAAVTAVAGTRTALAQTLGYVGGRLVFGRPVASFENTRYALAGLQADLSVAAVCTQACVTGRLSGSLDPLLAAAASLRCTDLFAAATDQCLQLHGGYGYMREYPISQAYADARYLRLLADRAAVTDTLAAGLGLTPAEVNR
jgi:alkylation response protein AidB-like acyl-CoA dehydrogenase